MQPKRRQRCAALLSLWPFAAAAELAAVLVRRQRPSRPRRQSEDLFLRRNKARSHAFRPRPGDHGPVIGAIFGRRDDQFPRICCAQLLQHIFDGAVGGDTACSHQAALAGSCIHHRHRFFGALRKVPRRRHLKRCCDIRHILSCRVFDSLRGLSHRGFEPGKRKVAALPAFQGFGEGEAICPAAGGRRLHHGSARRTQPQQLGGFIKRLPRRIIYGGAEAGILPDAIHPDELGMAAGYEQQQIGKIGPLRHSDGQRVSFQMINRNQRQIMGEGNRLGGGEADHDPTHKAWPSSGGDGGKVAKIDTGSGDRFFDRSVKALNMAAGGDLGHHAPKRRMVVMLRPNLVRQYPARPIGAAVNHGGSGVVAARFNAENKKVVWRGHLAACVFLGGRVKRMDIKAPGGARASTRYDEGRTVFKANPVTDKSLFPIASRRSPLAMAQAELVRAMVAQAAGIAADRAPVKDFVSTGDKNLSGSLAEIGGKGLFTKEIEDALLSGEARFAVHSMKDMPAVSPPGLVTAAIPAREDPCDVFISPVAASPWDLPQGAKIGSASVRRLAQVLARRPDLQPVTLRGNVGTRLEKLKNGEADATFLALAGLNRLGMADVATAILPPQEMLPAVGQGALCVQAREDDLEALEIAVAFTCTKTSICVAVERAFLAGLDGSCKTPIAGLAVVDAGDIRFRGELLSLDGRERFNAERHIPFTDNIEKAMRLGADAANEIRSAAGEEFFKRLELP